MFSNSNNKTIDPLKDCYDQIATLPNRFSLTDNQSAVKAVNASLIEFNDLNHINTIIFGSRKTALSLAQSYAEIVTKLSEQPEETDFFSFINAFKSALSELSDRSLFTRLNTQLEMLSTEHKKRVDEEARQQRIRAHQNFAVRCLTVVAYGLYIDTISGMVPMSPVRVPGSAIYLALIGATFSHLTAGYKSKEEDWNGMLTVGDRLLSSSGLRYCYETIPAAVEKLALTVAGNVHRGTHTLVNALPNGNQPIQALPASNETPKITKS